MDDERTKRVVVVGGSFAGRRLERLLSASGHFDVTLVDAKGFWEYHPAACRALVEPSAAARIVKPQPRRTVVGTVEAVEAAVGTIEGRSMARTLRLRGGSTIQFDFCVLCTGASYTAPIKSPMEAAATVEERRRQYKDAHEQLAAAQSVVVVGGGFVGVELAAEIVAKWGRSKRVTLLCNGGTLVPRLHPQVGQACLKWLTTHGVEVLLNTREADGANGQTNNVSSRRVVTGDGRTIDTDIIYRCTGARPCATALREHYPGALAADTGSIIVNEYLQVEGLWNVLAVGDCTDAAGEKNALSADLGATLAARNVAALAGRGQRGVWPQDVCHGARKVPTIVCVSLGKWSGVMQFNGLVLSGLVPAAVKALIEHLQLATAEERGLQTGAWDLVEKINVLLGRHLFVGWGAAQPTT